MGIQKDRYWEATLEDALDLCAKVARIAAIIYHNCYGDNTAIPKSDPWLDYAANFSHLMGFETKDFWELMRLYIVLHA
jgi:citrate synthase